MIDFGNYSDGLNLGSHYITAENDGFAIFSALQPNQFATSSGEPFFYDFGRYPNAGYGAGYSADIFTSYTGNNFGGIEAFASHTRGAAPTVAAFNVVFGGTHTTYFDGALENTSTTNSVTTLSLAEIGEAPQHQNSNGPVSIGRQAKNDGVNGNDRYFYGIMGDLIMYDRALPTADRQKVQTYLGVKYGITLQHNYIASNDATIWDIAANAAYHNDVAAIGRDDASLLSQLQSGSENAGALVTMGLDSISAGGNATHGSSFATDLSFIVWGLSLIHI